MYNIFSFELIGSNNRLAQIRLRIWARFTPNCIISVSQKWVPSLQGGRGSAFGWSRDRDMCYMSISGKQIRKIQIRNPLSVLFYHWFHDPEWIIAPRSLMLCSNHKNLYKFSFTFFFSFSLQRKRKKHLISLQKSMKTEN